MLRRQKNWAFRIGSHKLVNHLISLANLLNQHLGTTLRLLLVRRIDHSKSSNRILIYRWWSPKQETLINWYTPILCKHRHLDHHTTLIKVLYNQKRWKKGKRLTSNWKFICSRKTKKIRLITIKHKQHLWLKDNLHHLGTNFLNRLLQGIELPSIFKIRQQLVPQWPKVRKESNLLKNPAH